MCYLAQKNQTSLFMMTRLLKTSLLLSLAALAAITSYGQNRAAVYLDTVAALDARRPLANETVYIRGYSAVGDWGNEPLPYRYDASSTNAVNRFCRSPITGVGRYIHDWNYSVKAFGATGDGVTDDTAAIDAATDYVLSGDYGELYFPFGTYVHSGWYIAPKTNTLLRIRGQNANPASAIPPRGSTIILKPGSTNTLLTVQFTNDPTKRLRIDVAGIYFHGNRLVCTNALDVVMLSGKAGPATNYITCGQWTDCSFNWGARHGILATNHLFQLELQSCNLQSNGDTALFLDRGGDHKFTKVLLEKAGKMGFYSYKSENNTWQDSDIGFCGAGVKLEDSRITRFVNTDISFHGGPCIELNGKSTANNMTHARFIGCRIGSANSSAVGVPLTYSNGTYSAVVFTGDSNLHFGHVFDGCMVLCSETLDTTLPKYIFEDQRTGPIFTNAPGFGVSVVNCAIATGTNYSVNGAWSPRFNEYAQIFAHANHGTTLTMTNQLSGLELRGRFNSYGIANFGNSTNTIPAVNVDGGVGGTTIQTWNRSGSSKIGVTLSGGIVGLNNVSNATQIVSFGDDATFANMYLGGSSGSPRTSVIYSGLPSGADRAAKPLRLISIGTGGGALSEAGAEVWAPLVTNATPTAAQTSTRLLFIKGNVTGKRTSMELWDNEGGFLRQVTTTNLTIYHTNGTVLHSGKFLIFE